ncbi:MAG: electron transfer flavoprotein subunit beta/FixA family protein [Dehalococcoidales bacterium]|nr:electron transfer flavoprotein subunit beta/FixA family protein [Dehalococcoidales bacterium]
MKPLNIVVCVKPVPDSRYWDRLSLDPNTKLLRREGIPIIMNPMDKNAIEEALKIKEERGGKITAVSMGPDSTFDVLAWAFALGCDDAILLSDRAFAGADTLATAYVLAAGVKKAGDVDLIILGNESLDGSTAQVGPQVAEFMGMPHLTNVEEITFVDDDTVHAKCKIEGGHMLVEAKLPVTLAVNADSNDPRVPPVFGALWATEKQGTKYTQADLQLNEERIGLAGSPSWVPEVSNIETARKGEVISGDPADIARQLIEKLKADGVLPEA